MNNQQLLGTVLGTRAAKKMTTYNLCLHGIYNSLGKHIRVTMKGHGHRKEVAKVRVT